MPRQGEEKNESKKHFKGEEIEWREAHDFEEFTQGNKKRACSFDKKWDRNVAWDEKWKLISLNLDVGFVFIPKRSLPQEIFLFFKTSAGTGNTSAISMWSTKMPSYWVVHFSCPYQVVVLVLQPAIQQLSAFWFHLKPAPLNFSWIWVSTCTHNKPTDKRLLMPTFP